MASTESEIILFLEDVSFSSNITPRYTTTSYGSNECASNLVFEILGCQEEKTYLLRKRQDASNGEDEDIHPASRKHRGCVLSVESETFEMGEVSLVKCLQSSQASVRPRI